MNAEVSFFIIVVDEHTRGFTVEGPMTDETALMNAAHRAQLGGRAIRCNTA
jgi:hypothetical protein